jgi:hypothetical protein
LQALFYVCGMIYGKTLSLQAIDQVTRNLGVVFY